LDERVQDDGEHESDHDSAGKLRLSTFHDLAGMAQRRSDAHFACAHQSFLEQSHTKINLILRDVE
jgi:hypothetical protein